jgi:hypothetical protein
MGARRLDRLLAALHRTDGTRPVLERICVVGVDAVGADGAGVSRFAAQGHSMAAASDPSAAEVEGLQIELSEGPCLNARETGHPFLEPDLRSSAAFQALADIATIGVLQERSTSAATESANGLQRALTSRIRIEQAKGILAERVGVGVDEAFEFLRRYARRHQAGITVIADGVVRRELDITPRQ